MRVGIVDIGSNTARLLVADVAGGAVTGVARRRAYLGLGAEIAATDTLTPSTIARTASLAAAYAERARGAGATILETVVTAPGRQADAGDALARALRSSTRAPVHVLDAAEEARLAFAGAVAAADDPPEVVGVVDVGGGSSELAVGTPLLGAAWAHSLDLGSLRLHQLALDADPPGARQVERARALVARSLAAIHPPRPDQVLAVGGSARGAARIVGARLGVDELREVIRIAAKRPARALEELFHLHPHRARTILAGAVLLEGFAARLELPLELGRGGVREGAALALARSAAAAA